MMAPDTVPASCCPGEARAAADVAACELALTDPTLSACCERDLKEQRQAARLRAVLAAADRTAAPARERARAVALGGAATTTPTTAWKREGGDSGGPDDEDDEDDEDDDRQLAQLREARMAELRRRAAERRSDGAAGFGRLCDAPSPGEVLEAARASGAARCVVHLAADGHDAGAQLDERLAELARGLVPSVAAVEQGQMRRRRRRARGGVLFLRAPAGAAAAPSAAALALCRELGLCGVGGGVSGALPRGALPALVVLSSPSSSSPSLPSGVGGGNDAAPDAPVAVACAPVARFCAEDGALMEDRVDAFLRSAGVLSSRSWGEKGGGGDEDEEEEEDEDGGGDDGGGDGKPCQLCGRTYPHEHVRAVYGRRDDDSDGG
jgi:hypothetical protein